MNNFQVAIVSWAEAAEALSQIRDVVFTEEQRVPEELEHDPSDRDYVHALASAGDGTPVGAGRLVTGGKIGRMAVLKPWRGKGVGRALLGALVEAARQQGLKEVILDSQVHACGFYAGEGFTVFGDEFMDAGIPHIKMKKAV